MANNSIYNAFERLWQHTQVETAQKLADAKAYTDEKIAAIPAQTDYTVTITEATNGLADGVAKKYTFTQNGAEIGSIDLAKELVVTAGSVKEVTVNNQPYSGAKVGDKYIELTIANQDTPIYVPAKDLVDIYTAKDGAAEVQVAISNTNEISATLVNGGVTYEKLEYDVQSKLDLFDSHEGRIAELAISLEDVSELANNNATALDAKVDINAFLATDGQVQANKEAIEAINNTDTGILKQAKDYADGLADNYAAAGHDHTAEEITGLANIARTGNVDDLTQVENTYIVFKCGTATEVI